MKMRPGIDRSSSSGFQGRFGGAGNFNAYGFSEGCLDVRGGKLGTL